MQNKILVELRIKKKNMEDCAKCAEEMKRMNIDKRFPVTVESLGHGAFGTVTLKENPKTGEEAAIKDGITNYTELISRDALREISALRALDGHPNVVKLIGYNLDSGGSSQIALEAASDSLAGALANGLNGEGGDTDMVRHVMFQIINAMYYMNGIGIWHRDMKPQNVLVFERNDMDDGDDEDDVPPIVKITDFGLSLGGPFQWISTQDVLYTIWYRAPEILTREIYGAISKHSGFSDPSVYNEAAEVFSVGATMWDVLCGSNMKQAMYMKDYDPSLQIWKFIRGLGKGNFDWTRCGETECSLAMFEKAFADSRMAVATAYGAKTIAGVKRSTLIHNFMKEIQDLPNTTDMPMLDQLSYTSEYCKQLLCGMLHPNPLKRMTMKQALDHPYFDSVRGQYKVIHPPSSPSLTVCRPTNSPFYVNDTSDQVTFEYYDILVNWLVEVATLDFKLAPAVMSLAIVLLQCYLRRKPIIGLKNTLQGYGLACLFLANIYLQDNRVKLRKFADMSDNKYTEQQIAQFAIEVFEVVGGMLHLPTPFVLLAQKIKDAEIAIDSTRMKPYALKMYELQNSEEALTNEITDKEIAERVFRMIILKK